MTFRFNFPAMLLAFMVSMPPVTICAAPTRDETLAANFRANFMVTRRVQIASTARL